jgi:hypothetical protein
MVTDWPRAVELANETERSKAIWFTAPATLIVFPDGDTQPEKVQVKVPEGLGPEYDALIVPELVAGQPATEVAPKQNVKTILAVFCGLAPTMAMDGFRISWLMAQNAPAVAGVG